MKEKETIGQRICAAVLSYELGISMERAMALYVRNRDIHPSWEAVGEELLKHSPSSASGSGAMKVGRGDVRPLAGAGPE